MLNKIIKEKIAGNYQQRITFAEYMDWALYHPQHGYYATNRVNFGGDGDFVTSPYLCKDFGELLAVQFAEIWEILGKPARFQLVEMGAGQGLLAADILKFLHKNHLDLFGCLEYLIVEKAAGLIAEQKHILEKLSINLNANIRWCGWEDIEENSITGCFFSNELVDALPVHLVRVENQKLQEVYVSFETSAKSQEQENFKEVIGEVSTPAIQDYFKLVGIDICGYEDGYRTEVNLAALDWMKTVANRLFRGYILTIDYGYTAERFYHSRRNEGTLQCYFKHSHHNDPYINLGYQDITAHVDFTALEKQGLLCGLDKVGFVEQGLFLMALGLGERIAALSFVGDNEDMGNVLRRREALHQLINPMGLGNFKVLVQSKNLNESQKELSFKGLKMPFI
ncbi:MAG TPA: class I SAM-dependent methyltransferase [Halomicronema sp.]